MYKSELRNVSKACVCLLVCLLVGWLYADWSERSLLQFRAMIKCVLPNSSPLEDFADYGCYCGFGGQGTPVDQLDQCCFVHDHCYSMASNLSSCDSLLDSPYVNIYDFRCDSATNTVTCMSEYNAPLVLVAHCFPLLSRLAVCQNLFGADLVTFQGLTKLLPHPGFCLGDN
uniref:Phospholipase A2 n=1 Tax=Pygocentrus nattereri TaxID=42514 RepID=A0A3B4D7C1_PYGNA